MIFFPKCRNVSFQLIFLTNSCANSINDFNEGVEFSIRLNTIGDWIPLDLVYRQISNPNNEIYIGERDNLTLRGYQVDVEQIMKNATLVIINISVCDFPTSLEFVQFRWLQTSRLKGKNVNMDSRDVWSLDDVHICYEDVEGEGTVLLDDTFDGMQLE